MSSTKHVVENLINTKIICICKSTLKMTYEKVLNQKTLKSYEFLKSARKFFCYNRVHCVLLLSVQYKKFRNYTEYLNQMHS